MALDDLDAAVPDGDDLVFLDEFSRLSLEEGLGSTGLISNYGSDKVLISVLAVLVLCANNFNKDIESVFAVSESVHFTEDRLLKLSVHWLVKLNNNYY